MISTPRDISTLSKGEIRTLTMLNGYLSEAETWIRSRAKRGLATYYKICELDTFMDVSLDAKVLCYRSKSSPNFDSARDNLVAIVEAGFLLSHDEPDAYRSPWMERRGTASDPLPELPTCRLFKALCYQDSSRDFASLLEIGSMRVEIVMRQERELAWA